MPGGIGVLIVNLGSPARPDAAAVRRYLAEFLSDPRVVELPPFIWQPVLRGAVLPTRSKRSARLYQAIWDRDRNASPLLAITADQAATLGAAFPDVRVDFAMRYGAPSMESRLQAMIGEGCDRILIAPLYPQYAAATTASVMDEVGRVLRGLRAQPAIRILPPYYAAPAYIAAVAGDVRDGLDALDFEPEVLISSFHGLPERSERLGDPYGAQCRATAKLLSEAIGRDLRIAFQSRFGRAKWLPPYFDEMLARLPSEGVRRIAVVAPGFAADCLETLEEIDLRGRKSFISAGGESFAYIPCLNAGRRGMAMLTELVTRELSGWRESRE
jgi:ferrochelatase